MGGLGLVAISRMHAKSSARIVRYIGHTDIKCPNEWQLLVAFGQKDSTIYLIEDRGLGVMVVLQSIQMLEVRKGLVLP